MKNRMQNWTPKKFSRIATAEWNRLFSIYYRSSTRLRETQIIVIFKYVHIDTLGCMHTCIIFYLTRQNKKPHPSSD